MGLRAEQGYTGWDVVICTRQTDAENPFSNTIKIGKAKAKHAHCLSLLPDALWNSLLLTSVLGCGMMDTDVWHQEGAEQP